MGESWKPFKKKVMYYAQRSKYELVSKSVGSSIVFVGSSFSLSYSAFKVHLINNHCIRIIAMEKWHINLLSCVFVWLYKSESFSKY